MIKGQFCFSGAEVGNWQRFLLELGYLDDEGNALTVDESFGSKTEQATRHYQEIQELDVTGALDLPTRVTASTQGFIAFTQAANATILWPQKRPVVDLIVIHTMEAAEKPGTARAVAAWFAGPHAPQASAHFCVDNQDVIQCVRDTDIAWHAPGANRNGIGIEHSGYASQSPKGWADEYSMRVLALSAKLSAKLALRFGVPLVHLSPENLRARTRGFAGHVDITNAFSGGKGHTDPGLSFPWDGYLARVRAEQAEMTR